MTLTMRGHTIDMARLAAQNSHKKALGNANMNARGDIIGVNGEVIATRENVAREYHKSNPKAVKQVSLRNLNQEAITFDTPAQAIAKQKELSTQQKSKRKISE